MGSTACPPAAQLPRHLRRHHRLHLLRPRRRFRSTRGTSSSTSTPLPPTTPLLARHRHQRRQQPHRILYNAVQDGEATCGASNANPDVWYRFTAPCNGTLVVDTCGSHDWQGVTDSGTDTVLSLHTACIGDTTNQIACNDDSAIPGCTQNGSIRDSRVTAVVTRGDIVRIRVAHFGTTGFGNGMFRIRASFTQSLEAPIVNTIANASHNCGSSYTGATPRSSRRLHDPASWTLPVAPSGMTINAPRASSRGLRRLWVSQHHHPPISAAGSGDRTWTLTVNRIARSSTPSPTPPRPAARPTPGPPTLQPACMNPVTSWARLRAPGMVINAATGVVSWPAPVIGYSSPSALQLGRHRRSVVDRHRQPGGPVLTDIPDATIACGPTPAHATSPTGLHGPGPALQLAAGSPAGMTINPATGVVSGPTPPSGSSPSPSA